MNKLFLMFVLAIGEATDSVDELLREVADKAQCKLFKLQTKLVSTDRFKSELYP